MPDPTRYLAKIDLSSHPEQDITMTPTGSTTSPQEARQLPKSPLIHVRLQTLHPQLQLHQQLLILRSISFILSSTTSCITGSLQFMCVMLCVPAIISRPHSWILPLPPLTVCAPYPLPPSHRASLPQRDSYWSVYPHDAPSPLQQVFRLTGGHLYFLGSISAVIGKEFRKGRWCSWERALRNSKSLMNGICELMILKEVMNSFVDPYSVADDFLRRWMNCVDEMILFIVRCHSYPYPHVLSVSFFHIQ